MSSTAIAGDFFGKYRVLKVLVAGRTTQVCEAIDDTTHQRVAIKALVGEARKSREQQRYLRHEFDVGSKLRHPRIIEIYEFGQHRETPYLVLELFPAPTMKAWIHEGVERVAHLVPRIVRQAAEGIAHLHQQGWIHRDLKPDNYLITPEGEVKLIDLALAQRKRTGLAKLFSGRAKIQGTKSYISPEQIRSKTWDERTDLYSFACTIFELIAGHPPFTAGSSNELLTKHLKSPPPALASANTNVTKEMSDLLRRTMAKNPDKRPASMQAFLDEFNAIEVFKNPPTPPADAGGDPPDEPPGESA